MEKLEEYIYKVLGQQIELRRLPGNVRSKLPVFFRYSYEFYTAKLYNLDLIFMVLDKYELYKVRQLSRQLDTVQNILKKPVVFVREDITAINRKKLIEQKINFIAPGKQMFLTHLLIDIETFNEVKVFNGETLFPSAQVLVLHHILYREDDLSQYTFKELAEKFGYTPMAITKAVHNLEYFSLIEVTGTKGKNIRFKRDIPTLWEIGKELFVNPVFKTVYTDKKPENLLYSNTTALEEYTDMNPGIQECFAIERNTFYEWEKADRFSNLNEEDGNYMLEVWKYNPEIIAKGITRKNNVDPLSLYLSLKNGYNDERTDRALDQIIKNYIW